MGLQSFPNLIALDCQDMLDLVYIHTIFSISFLCMFHAMILMPLSIPVSLKPNTNELHRDILIEGIKSLLASRISSDQNSLLITLAYESICPLISSSNSLSKYLIQSINITSESTFSNFLPWVYIYIFKISRFSLEPHLIMWTHL
jgi:hypothetical protein